MELKKAIAITAVCLTTLASAAGCSLKKDSGSNMRDITTQQVIEEMGVGINLGNTFESCGDWINSSSVTNYETGWGSCVITKECIKGMADAGFGVLRVPVAWSNMMSDDGKYTLSDEYVKRVKEVVGWALDDGMYVIMNIHWDGGWWTDFPTDYDECMKHYTTVWTQLCKEFGSYGDKLMFESLNEEGCWDSVWNQWSGSDSGKEEAYGYLNDINQKFVDIVRKSGGNNAKRHLLIAGYATDIGLTCDDAYKMPDDPAKRCAVSVHYYTPSTFCILEADADWGKAKATWGTDADYAELNRNMDKVCEKFTENGVPVIIGEYGVATGNKDMADVREYIGAVASAATERKMCPVLWDTWDNTNKRGFYDRVNCVFSDTELLDAIMAAKKTK